MSLRLSFQRAASAAAMCLLAAGARADDGAPCATRERCLDAIMDAARAGRQAEEIAAIRALRRQYGKQLADARAVPQPRLEESVGVGDPSSVLTALLRQQKEELSWLPERRRALALAYLQAGQLADAERELGEGLADDPTHAPYWLDLAAVYMRQGSKDKAVSALVVAQAWAQDATSLRRAYAEASARPGNPDMAPLQAQAVQAIGARMDALARHEAKLAPQPYKPAGNGASRTPPVQTDEDCGRPVYPRTALRRNESGKVTLEFLVDAAGKPVQIRKARSSGHAALDNEALLSLAACRFNPPLVDGKPVAGWTALEYVWQLD